ncbi:phospholipase D family protein [Peptoniphilus equinus]|uniref:Phospholipase D family protein n=1 Tax=Peptoniphilus equinus TaxID=3016343 RepID=A0ABY7QTN5_9FIRM|nr:phospholipase D family protein [Peptoniphilus equinus]WBW49360.1 phospholipase D family protein [Peptoniphilus equinus]
MQSPSVKLSKLVLWIVIALIVLPILYALTTQNPKGTNVHGEFHDAEATFIYDLSAEKDGTALRRHNIFAQEMDLIRQATSFLVVDLFLYNDNYTPTGLDYPKQVQAMTDLLIAKKVANPQMPIIFITDPINNFYGAYLQSHIKRLMDAGIDVTITDHNTMRDSNPLISGPYRAYFQWFGTSGKGWLPNFFQKDGPKVTLRSVLKLANFKGNHRKVLISDKEAIVASANPHDPSAFHSNVAIRFKGSAIKDLLHSELALIARSYPALEAFEPNPVTSTDELKIATEGAIGKNLHSAIAATHPGDAIDIAIFYISDFTLLNDLGEAADRGVKVRIIADLNKDAFGIEKNGSPNRPALSELIDEHPAIQLRWYNTHGEQFHTKMAHITYRDRPAIAILGSANFTRRNLRDFNLETDVVLKMDRKSPLHDAMTRYFTTLWHNNGAQYTLEPQTFYESGFIRRTLWKIQEVTGLCTW